MHEFLNINIIVQLLINGILFGTMYGIAAIGLSLIFGTMRIMFLAQGSMIILFAYVCYWLFALLGLDPYLSLFLIVLLGLGLGAGIYQGVVDFCVLAQIVDLVKSIRQHPPEGVEAEMFFQMH